MARARNIKPGFWTNEHIVELTPWARLLFIGLWAVADREGRLEDRPKRIKMEIFPADSVDVDDLLSEIAMHGLVHRYSVNGQKLVWIPGFKEHQNPHQNEKRSDLPPHPDDVIAPLPEHSRNVPSNPAESLNTESLNTDTGYLKPESIKPARKRADVVGAIFATFWDAYPRKVNKQAAEKAFRKVDWHVVNIGDVMAALQLQSESEQWTKDGGRFIPHAATWLNNARWQDELTPAKPATPASSIAEPKGYSHDPEEAKQQLHRDLEELRRKATSGGGNVTAIRGRIA